MTQPPDTQSRSGGGLTQKVGPLPTWGWIALAAAGGIGVLLWMQNRRKNAAAVAGTAPAVDVQGADAATVANLQDQLATVMSQIRDTQAIPLTPGPTGPAGSAGPVGPPGAIGPPGTPVNVNPVQIQPVPSRTTITSGESVAPMLAFFGMTQQQFESLNPGIQQTYYHKPGTNALAFSLPGPRIVNVPPGKGW